MMRRKAVSWKAHWIWHGRVESPRTSYLRARRQFALAAAPETAVLHITADSRYRLYVNGGWLGDGPARSWGNPQQFDTYDVTGLMRKGKNSVAVLVRHFGEGTFHYIPGRGGLLCQLDIGGPSRRLALGTDRRWKVSWHPGFARPTCRISCQMDFEEQFDGRAGDGWTQPEFDDRKWKPASVVGPAGCAPWRRLEARSIPHLTREPVYPVRVVRRRLVSPPSFEQNMHIKPYFLEGDRTSNPRWMGGCIAAEIVSPAEQAIEISGWCEYPRPGWFLNGQRFDAQDPDWYPLRDVTRGRLKKGRNLIIARVWGTYHEFDFKMCGRTRRPVEFHVPGKARKGWLAIGPFKPEEKALAEKICRSRSARELKLDGRVKVIRREDMVRHNIWNLTTYARTVQGEARVDNVETMLTDAPGFAVFHPCGGKDMEILIDFGRELVGYLEFDVEGEEGTVLDWNLFEGIEPDGRLHYTETHLNSARYVTHRGRQKYTTLHRYGFRYAFLTVRNLREPLKIHCVRCLLSTYPSVENGAFRSNDWLLNRIWEVGRYTLKLCSEDTYTDCPCYEQTFWVGDSRNEALIDYAAYGNFPLAGRCVELVGPSLSRSPIPESQVPSAWQNIIPAWSFLWVMMAQEYWMASGDRRLLGRVWPAIRRTLRGCQGLLDERGLFSMEAWNLFDWAPQDTEHRVVAHNQMLLAGALDAAIEMGLLAGTRGEVEWLRAFRRRLVHAVNLHLWDNRLGAYVDSIHDDGTVSKVVSQQTNSLALLYDVAPPARARQIMDWPERPSRGAVKVGSPFALFFILEALAKQGRYESILRIIRDRWGSMVREGATTFWETFPGFDSHWQSRSLCHAWSAAPTYFLSRYQLGVEPLEPGYRRVRIAPVPCDLTWCQGRVPTPRGPISVEWEKTAREFQIEVVQPEGVSVELALPFPASRYPNLAISPAGHPGRRARGVRVVRRSSKWVISWDRSPGVRVSAGTRGVVIS